MTADRKAGQSFGEVFPHLAAVANARRCRRCNRSRPSTGTGLTSPSSACRTARRSRWRRRAGARQDDRPVARLPLRRSGGLRDLVRPAAPRAGDAEGSGVRPDRAGARAYRRRPAGRLPRLLSDLRAAAAGADRAYRPDRRRRHRHRRQVGGERRRPRRQGRLAVRRGRGGRPRLRRRLAPARAGDRAARLAAPPASR